LEGVISGGRGDKIRAEEREASIEGVSGLVKVVSSGFNRDNRIRKETQALTDWVRARKLVPSSSLQLARYDPPWVLPMLRRNEIQLEIKD